MHRKVNLWLAFLVIFIVAGIFAWVLSVRAFSSPFGSPIAVQIDAVPMKCVVDPCPGSGCGGSCQATCGICGTILWTCANLYEVKVTWKQGRQDALMYGAGGTALCLMAGSGSSPMPAPTVAAPNRSFTPQSICFGRALLIPGVGHTLFNFGCSY